MKFTDPKVSTPLALRLFLGLKQILEKSFPGAILRQMDETTPSGKYSSSQTVPEEPPLHDPFFKPGGNAIEIGISPETAPCPAQRQHAS
ncbi:MAG: hypothetical protein AB1427_01240 [Thermodesulfobacteriota bacterium]